MSKKFKTIITTAGAEKLAAATVPGGKKVNLTAMAVGDGGGTLPEPNAGQTKLINEVWRHALNKISQDNKNKNYIVAELVIPPDVGGFWMRELGLYDDAGTLIAVANMAESYKPKLAEGSGRAQTCRMVIIVSSVDSVALSIDATTVMATQDYVDDKLAEHEQSRKHPDATLNEKGFTQLSSATESTSETLAATPKAVKAAYDLASGKYTAQDATTAQKGIVKLSSATDSTSETLAATPKAVKAAYDIASGKYTAQDATTAQKGIVKLSSATDSESELLAATPKAVKAANDNANGRVPSGRKVNGKALTGDINITSADVGAVSKTGDKMTGDLTLADGKSLKSDSGNLIHFSKDSDGYIQIGDNVQPIHIGGTAAGEVTIYSGKGINLQHTVNTNRYFNVKSAYGAGSYASQYNVLAPYYNEFNSYATSEYHPLWKQKDLSNKFMWSGGVLVNADDFVIHYMSEDGKISGQFYFKKDGTFVPTNFANFDARYQAKGNYMLTGAAYTKAESDGRFQPKGSYTPAGQAYTKAESDARYLQDIRLGAQVLVSGSGNGGKASLTAPSGHMLTAILDGDTSRWPMPDSPDQAYARPIQKKLVNGNWITVEQL